MSKIIFKVFGFTFIILGILGLIITVLNLHNEQSQAYDVGFLIGNVVVVVLFFLVGVKFLKKASSSLKPGMKGLE